MIMWNRSEEDTYVKDAILAVLGHLAVALEWCGTDVSIYALDLFAVRAINTRGHASHKPERGELGARRLVCVDVGTMML